ncbi:c-type cytochrome biogenesis protein CcsB [Corynebacterium tapiri]|uniref:C-type cytochrome biogenesis protein CcsB n=1 Tax=Corynebacterium tapiri TaxID=1448266 RepID=A0A5C4U2X2_9CORY|nr:c-type cytochrome biogenesis protein CcsB [Corynebacterium tapiri]TNL97288.1 c-type cytochrome biogenesis protein CcsB [Corynebacterium tapiri]
MPVDQTLSNYSDLAFQSAFVLYVVALAASAVLYTRMQTVVESHRARTAERTPVLVGAGGPDIPADSPALPEVDGAGQKAQRQATKAAGITQALVWLAIVFHTAAVILRGLATQRFPLGNLYEYVLTITLGVMIIIAVALTRTSWRVLWPWVLTPMLALMFYGGTKLYAESAPVVPALQSHWLPIHVSTVSIGASIGIVSGVFSLLYLLRMWQTPGQEKGVFGFLAKPLPSAKRLDALAYKSAIFTLPVFGLGVVLGAIWAESAWGRFWGWDPKETMAFVTWILYAAYLHARATAGWKDYRAAIINIVALASMIFNLFFINLVVSGLHSYAGLN